MKLNSGINLGGFLSQCEHRREHYDTFIRESDLKQIAQWGYDHVRLPIDYEVLEDEAGNVIEAGYDLVETVVKWSSEYGMNIVLDLHKAYGYNFENAINGAKNDLFSNDLLQKRFVDLWVRIATRFSRYDNVAFELLNEVVEKENADAWNGLIRKTVKVIRDITERVPIIYGGIQWNSVKTLKLLEPPTEKNIIFTFHFYEPFLFTHQKAYWIPLMDADKQVFYPETMEYYRTHSETLGCHGDVVRMATSKEMGEKFVQELVQEAVTVARQAGVDLYCGEFGVIDKAPVEDTLRWYEDVHKVFSENQIGCTMWSYKEMDFGLIGEHYDSIRKRLITLWTQE